jgi:hypothetical protein
VPLAETGGKELRMDSEAGVPEGLVGTSWGVLPDDCYFSVMWEVRSSAESKNGGGGLGRKV